MSSANKTVLEVLGIDGEIGGQLEKYIWNVRSSIVLQHGNLCIECTARSAMYNYR